MKPFRFYTSRSILCAVLMLSVCICLSAFAETDTLFPWLDNYTLDVALVSTDPAVVNDSDAPSDGTVVLVKLISPYGLIQTEDIETHSEEIRFRDADNDEYTAYSWRVSGVDFDAEKGFSTKPQQEGFEMLYNLQGKTADALNGAQLLIPAGVEDETIIVALDNAPREAADGNAAAESAEGSEPTAASFVLGGIRYTISALEDSPAFPLPNLMDGKGGHVVAFSYPGSGAEAEDANNLLYSGARLRQPNGDLVSPYSNSDNIGNPYELYFGLSDNVLLSDCVFTLQSDEGEVEIPLANPTDGATQSAENQTPSQDEATTAEPAATVTPSLTAERASNTFSLTVGGATYEMALDSVAYDDEEKLMGVDIIFYDHDLLEFVVNKQLIMPFGCGIISTKDGFLYTEGITATLVTPMHLIFYFDTKNLPDLVCFGKLNESSYEASEDFALVDPTTRAFVTTFPLTALSDHKKDPDGLLNTVTSDSSEPAATVTPTSTPMPTVTLSEGASDTERMIVAVLTSCAQDVKDEWQLAIYRAGVKDVQAVPDQEGVYTFLLRSFNPELKALGKYQDDNQIGYLSRLLDNTKQYKLSVSLTLTDGTFTDKSVKALRDAVKKAAASSSKAFKDKGVLQALTNELFFSNFPSGIKQADDLYEVTPEYAGWQIVHSSALSGLNTLQWAPFFYSQTKQTLDVTGGPFALRLTSTGVNMEALLENARADALNALTYMDYDSRWDGNRVESEFRKALADNFIAMRKKGKEAVAITLNVDSSPVYDSAYPAMLNTYAYEDALNVLTSDTENMPEQAALAFPKAGWMSGSTSGTQVRIKAPKDSAAYYVQLRNYNTDEIAVSGFVRPGSTCTLRLPKGDYYFVMASGSVWYGEENLFGDSTEYTKTGLFEVMGSNYYHTITLKVTENGNMPIYGADEGDLRN